MYENITEIVGTEEGPTNIIIAGVHGNEKCGIGAFKKILPSLEIEKGKVIFIYGNPRAIEANKRFTEANLNRMFKGDEMLTEAEKKSYEYSRAQFLKPYLNQADVMLDIHASTSPESKSFIICEDNAKEITQYLPVDLIVTGFDAVQPGGTDYYMNSIGKVGICIECGYLSDPKSSDIALVAISSFLKARGHVANDLSPQKQDHIHIYHMYMTKTDSFTIAKEFADFEDVSKGEILGTDGDETVTCEKDSVILFASQDKKQANSEAFLLGEKKNSLA